MYIIVKMIACKVLNSMDICNIYFFVAKLLKNVYNSYMYLLILSINTGLYI